MNTQETETVVDLTTTKEYAWAKKNFPSLTEDEVVEKVKTLQGIQDKLNSDEYKEAKKFINNSKPFYKRKWFQLTGTGLVGAVGAVVVNRIASN